MRSIEGGREGVSHDSVTVIWHGMVGDLPRPYATTPYTVHVDVCSVQGAAIWGSIIRLRPVGSLAPSSSGARRDGVASPCGVLVALEVELGPFETPVHTQQF